MRLVARLRTPKYGREYNIAVEPFHFFRYADEQAFRFNNRKDALGNNVPDALRFAEAMGRVAGHRLTYSQLNGEKRIAAPR